MSEFRLNFTCDKMDHVGPWLDFLELNLCDLVSQIAGAPRLSGQARGSGAA